MKNTSFWFTASAIATIVPLMGMSTAHAYDDMPRPPPPPKGWVHPPKPTENSVVQHVETQTSERFAAAAGGDVNGMLSRQQAQAAGWGFVSDHFSEIDQSGSGYVRLDDVLRFQSQRTPQQVMRMKAAAKTSTGADSK
ncbi:hypothetical protein NU688_07210 [Variovorax sp. ZS18.2.2]|uniref:hypothetical protein n=1 Tax=Variovorax sp. ZS18.2.2 TaxID=2971255 RepID=UPI0021513C01|nr:hypothetical protein [Variovorax sp. ZS18.2.2]MCR6475939.1 hypothetical protein [Variovorax sp. ZS18.2.2]